MKKNDLLSRYIFILLLLIIPNCSSKHHITVIKLAHALDTNHPVHMAMEYMAERLAEKSNGQMRIQIFPNGQLGSERELIELLKIGII